MKRDHTASGREANMECADWLSGGFDSAQARFLMLTAITHHRFSSRVWGEHEVRRLYAELMEIDVSATRILAPRRRASAWIRSPAWRAWWCEGQAGC